MAYPELRSIAHFCLVSDNFQHLSSYRFSELIKACIQETTVVSSEIQDDLYDHQFFYFVDNVGHCLTGDVRDYAISVFHNRIPMFLDDLSWILTGAQATSPAVRKRYLTHICMSRIASRGLQCVDPRLKSMKYLYYSNKPPWSEALYQTENEVQYLFICETGNFLIDGIIICRDKEKRTVDLYPLQIGSTPEDPCLDKSFCVQEWEECKQTLATRLDIDTFTIRITYVFLYCGVASESSIEERKFARDGGELAYKLFKCGFTILDGNLQRFI